MRTSFLSLLLFVVASSVLHSQDHLWTLRLKDRTIVDSLKLDSVTSAVLRFSRNGDFYSVAVDSIAELQHPQPSLTFLGGLFMGLGGVGIGEFEYQQHVAYSGTHTGSDIVHRLPYYAGGFLLGFGMGALFTSLADQDEVHDFRGLPHRARVIALSDIIQSQAPELPPTFTETPSPAKNAVYLEAFGPGFLYSINYERFVANKFALRIGFEDATLDFGENRTSTITVPVMGNYFSSTGSHKLEIGVGADFLYEHGSRTSNGYVFLVGSVGYRYQPDEGGFQFRLVATPFVFPTGNFMWFGSSIGMCF
jgi:hypothetical protein